MDRDSAGNTLMQAEPGRLKALRVGPAEMKKYDYWKYVESCDFQESVNCAPHAGLDVCSDQDASVFLAGCKIGCTWDEEACPSFVK